MLSRYFTNDVLKITVLTVFFLILCEKLSFINLATGLLVAWMILKVGHSEIELKRYLSLKVLTKWGMYGVVLFYEVIKANLQVAVIALSREMDVKPVVVSYESRLTDSWLLTVLANSITLTPGTMTVDIKENKLLIHCLNHAYSESVANMRLEDMLFEIEEIING